MLRVYLGSLLVLVFLFSGCSTQPIKTEPEKVRTQAPGGKIWLFKPAGTLFCRKKQPLRAVDVVRDLQSRGIQVFEYKAGRDNRTHMVVCGAPTGHRIEVLVGEQFIDIMRKIGFQEKLTSQKSY